MNGRMTESAAIICRHQLVPIDTDFLQTGTHTRDRRVRSAALTGWGVYRRWLFLTGIRGLLAIALDDRERAESAYQALLPFAARPAGADTMLITLWPVAHILGDLARYLRIPGAQAHYKHALAIAEHAHVESWREAAIRRLD